MFTWTGNPAASIIEAIRWEVGDTASANPKFSDEEVQYAYDQEGSVLGAAAHLCEQLSSRYAESINRQLGSLRVDARDMTTSYANKAAALRKSAVKYAVPYGGGISLSKQELFDADTDIIPAQFDVGIHDNKQGGTPSGTTGGTP